MKNSLLNLLLVMQARTIMIMKNTTETTFNNVSEAVLAIQACNDILLTGLFDKHYNAVIEAIHKVKIDDVVKIADKIELDTIYFMTGKNA